MLAMWLLITITMVIFIGISFSEDISLGSYTLTKARFPETLLAKNDNTPVSLDSIEETPDTVAMIEEEVIEPDTTVHKLLIFGDSMTHNLAMSIGKYGTRNNYKVTGVAWESSSTLRWAKSGKIREYIETYKPDYIIISLGSNEMDLKNFELRAPYVSDIVKQLGDIPYVWVGPPLWKEDKGLYPMILQGVPKDKFFRTGNFDMERGPDHIHPTRRGADAWADTIMKWIAKSPHPILTEKPDSGTTTRGHKFIYLHPED